MDKKADIKYFYNYVHKSSMINDFASTRHPSFDYAAAESMFNQYLDKGFKITFLDGTEFIPIFRQYSNWLLAQYISSKFMFNDICSKYELSKIKDPSNRYDFFLASTFKYFIDDKIGDNEFSSVVAYKIYLGILGMLFTIKGYSSYEYDINRYKELITEMKGAEK